MKQIILGLFLMGLAQADVTNEPKSDREVPEAPPAPCSDQNQQCSRANHEFEKNFEAPPREWNQSKN